MSDNEEVVFRLDKETGEYVEIKKPLLYGMPVVKDSQKLTVEKIKQFLPKKYGGEVNAAVVAEINRIEEDTGLSQSYAEEQLLTNMHLLEGSGRTLMGLTNAIKYCNLREHFNNKKAWAITFPKEYDKLVSEDRFVDSHVSMYNKSALVTDVMKTMLVASNIVYQPLRAAAIRVQANLMNGIGAKEDDRVSPTVQQIASAKIIDMTELDQDNSIELKLGLSDAAIESQNNLSDSLRLSALAMQNNFKAGKDLGDVQKLNITIDATVSEDD